MAGAAATLALSVAVLALVAMLRQSGPGTAPGGDSADAGFARDMAVHHQQAVELSFLVRERTDDENVRRLAFDVINTQATQRGMLLGWLESWDLPTFSDEPPMAWRHQAKPYEPHDGSLMPGMATERQTDELRTAEGKAAEVLYLQLMTAHHRSGVDMARDAVNLAESEQVSALARGMVRSQRSEMKLMADLLASRGAGAPT